MTAEIYSIAVDLKVPEKGPVQILEIMPSHIAGKTGYDRDGKNMVQDYILPYLRERFPRERVTHIDGFVSVNTVGSHYGFDLADAGHGVIYPERNIGTNACFRLMRSELLFAKRNPAFKIVNADQNFLALQNNKAAMALVVNSDDRLRPFFAPSLILPTAYDKKTARRIVEKLGQHETYVIKPVDEKHGNGVRMVSRDNLDEVLHQILCEQRKGKDPIVGRNYWKTDINPVFVVQPHITSKPVSKNGQNFDGTMRVFATLCRAPGEDGFDVKVHDGYWKLPHKPLNGEFSKASSISYSPSREEDGSKLVFLLSRLARRGLQVSFGAINSLEISDAERANIFPQLETVLPGLMKTIASRSLSQRIGKWLDHDRAEYHYVAAMLSADPICFPGADQDEIPMNTHAYAAGIAKKLVECSRKENRGVLTDYLLALHDRVESRDVPYGMKDSVLDPIVRRVRPISQADLISIAMAVLKDGPLIK